MNNVKEAFNRPGIVVDRWVLRLGKNDAEAGRFEPWFLPNNTFEQDFAGFIACLNLLKLIDAVKERMSTQAKGVRAIKKQMNAEQKEIAKMKAKVEKAAAKAQLKLDRAVERARIKDEAKAAREEAKLAKLSGKVPSEKLGDKLVGGVEPINEVPRQAEDTPAITVVPEASSEVPKVAGNYEEAPVAHLPFVIPEEG